MSYTRNNPNKLPDKSRTDLQPTANNYEQAEIIECNASKSCTYAVTASNKAPSQEALCSSQKSFISIHSTDQLCQVNPYNSSSLEDCNVEVLSLNKVFPSTSEESLSNDELPVQKKVHKTGKMDSDKVLYSPMNSKSVTGARQKEPGGQGAAFSDFNLMKNTLHVVGSNPGEPKMSYQDPPKKISKTMKKFLRNIDKHKSDQLSKCEKTLSKLTTMRGILKDGRCGTECTGDSAQSSEDYTFPVAEDLSIPFSMDLSRHCNYTKNGPDKSVSFNTQVVIIHFTGDLCVGQSVETLSKEKDQQARNSELRKTFLTKYNEFWPTQK